MVASVSPPLPSHSSLPDQRRVGKRAEVMGMGRSSELQGVLSLEESDKAVVCSRNAELVAVTRSQEAIT